MSQPSAPASAVTELAGRAEALWRRLKDIERALAVQEWWMLGRALPEARLLAEIGSLFAVASGELENTLIQSFHRPLQRYETTDPQAATYADPENASNDPAWLAASRDQALGLLRMVAPMLGPMRQYADMLTLYGERLGLPVVVIDAFGIVSSRLAEVDEALRQPPR
jgi:hypothetical protein